MNSRDKRPPSVLAHPFRPFFLAAGIYAQLVVLAWIAFLFGALPLAIGWAPLQWHSHEMLYGLISAPIAGFILTAMTNWTGAKPLQGYALLSLLSLWILGRVVMCFAAWLPGWLVAGIDLAFLPVLAIYVSVVLIRYQNRRNLVLVAVLALLFSGNLLMHIGFLSAKTNFLIKGELVAFDLITMLIVIIAGRIIPAFTGNWLRAHGGDASSVKTYKPIEVLALASVASLVVCDLFGLPPLLLAVLALLATAFNAIRLFNWSGLKTLNEPLLWILHLAYLWLVFALLLRGLSYFSDAISASLWQHALAIGGIATIILGVMTRVCAGHTGRPLGLPKYGVLIYFAIVLSAALRMVVAADLLNFRIGISASALAWVIAFGLFTIIYGPILCKPRADGKPG